MSIHIWDRETEVKDHSRIINGVVRYNDQASLLTFCGEWIFNNTDKVGLSEDPNPNYHPTCEACILMKFEREAEHAHLG